MDANTFLLNFVSHSVQYNRILFFEGFFKQTAHFGKRLETGPKRVARAALFSV
jgi:hypothetical protein